MNAAGAQEACKQGSLVDVCLQFSEEANTRLIQWAVLCLGKVCARAHQLLTATLLCPLHFAPRRSAPCCV